MSQIVQIKTQIRDRAAVAAVCRWLNLAGPADERVRLFNAQVQGLAVRLPNWRFPVVCDLVSGEVKFDHYGGRCKYTVVPN